MIRNIFYADTWEVIVIRQFMSVKFVRGRECTLMLRGNKSVFISLGLLSLMMIFIVVAGVVYVNRGYSELGRTREVMQENALLRSKITEISSELDSMMLRLELMENWEDDIRSRENFKEIDKEVRKMGIGGLPQIDGQFSLSDPQSNFEYNLLINRMNHLQSKVAFDFKSHEELHSNYQLRQDLYRSTPTIYPTFGRISSGYGRRKNPISGKRDFHHGIDFANKRGTPIYATADGTISKITRTAKMGRYIKIRHNFGFETVYGHLSKIEVRVGQQVQKGQIIARMGNTGESTGAHLHYEVHRYSQYRNPSKYLSQSETDIVVKK